MEEVVDTVGTGSIIVSGGGGIGVSGQVTVGGAIYAGSGGFDSDETLKNIIWRGQAYTTKYSVADELELLRYTWKNQEIRGDRERYTYSAQQVQKLVPEAVTNGETLAIDYTQLHCIVIDEHTRRIQKLERELADLKKISTLAS